MKSDGAIPLVSVITVCYNSAATIEKTIKSVVSQSYGNIEYIIVDGGSTDGTVDIIKKYESSISKWISEPDEGISDAFNKGIAMSDGEFVQLVNADDWLSVDQIEKAVSAISDSDYGYVFGDMMMYDPSGEAKYLQKGDPEYASKIRYNMPMVNHPTVVAKKKLYDEIGCFDDRYKIAMDYDWLSRVHKAGYKGCYNAAVVGNMTLCGVSDENFKKAYKEVMEISVLMGTSWFIAKYLYFLRVFKKQIRHLLELIFPENRILKLRRVINRTIEVKS